MSKVNGLVLPRPVDSVWSGGNTCQDVSVVGAAAACLASFLPAFIIGILLADALLEMGQRTVDLSFPAIFVGAGFAIWSVFLMNHVVRKGSMLKTTLWLAAIGHTMGMVVMAALS